MRIPFLNRETKARQTTTPDFDSQVSAFWDSLKGGGFSPSMIDKVWAASRCIQLNAQQIAAMPLRFYGPPGASDPAWVSSPDPAWFPNGIGDAVFAAIRSLYGWGDAFLLVTARYATGFPSAWTVLDPAQMTVKNVDGRRQYELRQRILKADDVVQVSRDPRGGLRGTSALRSFSEHMLSAIASADLARTINEGGVPNAVLKSRDEIDQEGAERLQRRWVDRAAVRRGAPAVLPPGIDFETLAFSPADLLLLEAQQFDARVIAAAFGVPPFLINLPLEGGLTYQSPAMLFETWWRTELRPAAFRFSQALGANMLPRGSWVEFDARDVLAPDFKELVEAWKLIVTDMGAASINEFRAAVLRLPPEPEAESIQDVLVPPTAATSGASEGASVQALRPVTEVIQ